MKAAITGLLLLGYAAKEPVEAKHETLTRFEQQPIRYFPCLGEGAGHYRSLYFYAG